MPNTLPPPDSEEKILAGMQVMLTAMVHMLGGSVVMTEAELTSIIDARATTQVFKDDRGNFTLKEVRPE